MYELSAKKFRITIYPDGGLTVYLKDEESEGKYLHLTKEEAKQFANFINFGLKEVENESKN